MNKIKCEIQSNIFENFPVGTIFSDNGDFYIKINQDEIYDNLCYTEGCNFGDKIDKGNVPNAVCLSDGKATYYNVRDRIDMIHFNPTLSIS